MQQKCRKCKRSYNNLLSHLKGTCKTAYQKEELEKMRKEARRQTHKKAYIKSYSPTIRHQKYVSSKNSHLKSKSPNTKLTDTLPLKTPVQNVLDSDSFDEGFKRMEILILKEIKRNKSSLLPPLQQKVNSGKRVISLQHYIFLRQKVNSEKQ